MMIQICDRAEFNQSKRERTPEGFLRVSARLSRCGVYDYSASACKRMPKMSEIRAQLGLKDSEPLKVYRSPEEVFDDASMSSFAMKPVTNNHPPEWITAKNARYYTIGHAGEQLVQDGIYQVAPLLITDEGAIKDVEEGKVEISNGYECDVIPESGITDNGEEYHAKFTNIRGNHIAIVSKGRAGDGCRISDSNPNGDKTMNMKTVVIDGIEHEVSENAAQIIGKLQERVQQVQDSLNTAKTEHATELATVQAKLDDANQKVTDAESKILDGAELDARIEARTTLVADAKTLAPEFDCSGKSDEQIVEGVVMEVCDGIDVSLEGKDADFKKVYCRARFDAALAVKDSEGDGSNNVKIGDKEEEEEDEGEAARKKFTKDSEIGYKGEKK